MSKVLYYGEKLDLIEFYGKEVLWINTPDQRKIPKMRFVGGYPNEYCIYLDDLTEEEKAHIVHIED